MKMNINVIVLQGNIKLDIQYLFVLPMFCKNIIMIIIVDNTKYNSDGEHNLLKVLNIL